jgi:hypothetical protein
MSDKIKLTGKVPRRKRRAIELFARDTPFKPKVEENPHKKYVRNPKHRNKDDDL